MVFRPFSSVSVLIGVVVVGAFLSGVTTILESRWASPRWPTLVAGGLWIAAGVVVVVWPDMTTRALAGVVGIALVVGASSTSPLGCEARPTPASPP